MIYGYARVSTDGQSVAAQVAGLRAAGAGKVFREVASGAKTDRAQLRKAIAALQAGDVLMVTRLDRLARSTRDLLNTLAAITGSKAGFRSLGDAWADTTTAHGRLMLTVLGGLAEFERDLIRTRTGEGRARAVALGQKMGRPPKFTPHQRREAIKRRDRGGESLADIGRSYNVSGATSFPADAIVKPPRRSSVSRAAASIARWAQRSLMTISPERRSPARPAPSARELTPCCRCPETRRRPPPPRHVRDPARAP